MKCKKIIIISVLILSIFVILANTQYIYAETSVTNGGSEEISKSIWGDALALTGAGNIILATIKWVGIAVLIGAIIVKGIKFVSVSPEGKAEIKKELIMLTIGAVILFAFVQILEIIINVVQNAGLQ